ncbi:MAG: 2-phosphosulfolactate phosphatase [Gammaproteobacteria bacterium]|jgi:2-phosphosulfolactate phosphatase|nr:2-phosphosulfolactate phosphatase [Gammaproteobacteria bacterium]
MVIEKKAIMQKRNQVACEWGESGLINSHADVIIIVDVLSFSTCIDIAVANGACVYPYAYNDATANHYAVEKSAMLALGRNKDSYSLSPSSLLNIPKDTRLVLPSPNGATLTLQAKRQAVYVLTACLRNASAVANAAMKLGERIAVIPAGERWLDNSLRVAYEDLIGSGAIIKQLKGEKTEEAKTAELIFEQAKAEKFRNIFQLRSALELIGQGFEEDVEIACQYDVSSAVPILQNEFFIGLRSERFQFL